MKRNILFWIYDKKYLAGLVIPLMCLTLTAWGQGVGHRFPSEKHTVTDEVTGIKITALTTSSANDSKIYQTHPQWTSDGKYIIFRSDRTGSGRYYAISMENYEIVQITAGDVNSNLHLGWEKNVAYYFSDGRLIELDLGGLLEDSEQGTVKESNSYKRVIAQLPDGLQPSGGLGLDANGERLFFAVRLEEDLSAIYSIDFGTGVLTKLLEVPFWANHLQANPWVSGEVMYCWETGGDAPQRIWFLKVDEDGNVEKRPLYKEEPEEWVTHEVFMDPDHILFNVMGHLERLRKSPTGVFMLNIRTNEVERLGQTDGSGYWHSAGTSNLKWVVADTFDGSLYRINTETGNETLLTTGHRPNSEGAHTHHSINPNGKWVLFNSSMLTDSDIMMVPLHPDKDSR